MSTYYIIFTLNWGSADSEPEALAHFGRQRLVVEICISKIKITVTSKFTKLSILLPLHKLKVKERVLFQVIGLVTLTNPRNDLRLASRCPEIPFSAIPKTKVIMIIVAIKTKRKKKTKKKLAAFVSKSNSLLFNFRSCG